MNPMLSTSSLTQTFVVGDEKIHAVDNVNIDIEPKTFTLLQGPSGSGKTTLLNLLGALDYPTKGSVTFKSHDITKLPDKRRDELRRSEIGFVFQSVALVALMSAFENIEFRLRISRIPVDIRNERARECLALVDLEQRMNHRPHELSGGEQQRVAIARAICNKPSVVFADEPTGELDTHNGLLVVKIFRDLVENEGITIVMASHDPNMAELADHVLFMEDGQIVSG